MRTVDLLSYFRLRAALTESDGNRGGSREKSAWPGLPKTDPERTEKTHASPRRRT
jgi:hypothetical protein